MTHKESDFVPSNTANHREVTPPPAADHGQSEGASRSVLQGIEHAARMLEVVACHPRGIRLTDLAVELGMHKATAYRSAASWRSLGYLSRLQDGSYVLGSKLFEVAHLFAANLDYRDIAHPILIDLNRVSGETVHFSIMDNGAALYLDKVEGRQPIRVYTSIGRRAPRHATASGKAMLAYLSDADVEATFLERFTDRTITDPDRLKEELEEIRRSGVAVNRGEWHEEVAGIGSPVFGLDGECVGAVSITFPAMYQSDERFDVLSDLVVSAARTMSIRLGQVPDSSHSPTTVGREHV
jgi:IclR family acetate operon transcriptional repressor